MGALEQSRESFSNLSRSRQNAVAREARRFMRENPGSADHNGFWQRLSARQVTELLHDLRGAEGDRE